MVEVGIKNWQSGGVAAGRQPAAAGWQRLAVALGLMVWSVPPTRADALPDKTRHHLFRPVLREQLRELSTDRPDQTESPFTVDAGHFQIEADLANGVVDRDRANGGEVRSQVWGFGGMNLKAGLWGNVDVQFLLDGYGYSRVKDRVAGVTANADGFGEVQTRMKINLWGNDGGTTAFALMPFVKWPLAKSALRNGRTEGGLILPLAVELPAGWELGLMTEVDWVRDASNAWDTEYFNTITFAHDIAGALGGYVELAARFTPESDAQWQGQIDVGLTYALKAGAQFDMGCNFGVTRAAPDFNPFIGITRRF